MPRGSQYIDGRLIHEETKQKLFFQTHVCTVYREILERKEQFLRTSAEHCMIKNIRKRQTHATMSILEDRFTLEKNKRTARAPFRSFLFYREIFDIRRNPTKPEFFVISVDSEVSGKKYYEVYKCKSREDAYKVETYIRRALEDSDKMVRSESYLSVVPVPSVGSDLHRSLLHVDFDGSVSSLEDDYRRSSIRYNVNYAPSPDYRYRPATASPLMVIQRPLQASAKSASPAVPREISIYTSPPSPGTRRRASSLFYLPEKDRDGIEGDVTYLMFDGRSGNPVVNENGPIYMFCDRHHNRR